MKNAGTILDIISNICPITGDGLADTILFTLILATSFCTAWKLTGLIADGTNCHNSSGMSLIHWVIRIIAFLILLSIVLAIVHLIRWMASWEWWVHLIVWLSIAAIVIVIIFLIIKKRNKQDVSKE